MLKFIKYYIDIILITVLGAGLRLYQLFEKSYSHDEYSALRRTGYNHFSELIEEGVKVDAHPPLPQVFINYWVKYFGDQPWVVKLPFIVLSIAAIPLAYAFAKRWFSHSAALILALLVATLQIFVQYSDQIRPYASGMFFALSLAWIWSIVVQSTRSDWKWMTYLGIAFALNAYNHHFNALLAALLWIIGWIYVSKENRKMYLGSSLIAVLLFAFNLPILLAQLKLGGISSIAPLPDAQFIIHTLFYNFHFSWLLICTVGAVALLGSIFFRNRSVHHFGWWCLFIYAATVGISYAYSYGVDSIMTDRNLMFALPFLLLFIIHYVGSVPSMLLRPVLIAIAAVSMYSLTVERAHFKVNKQSAYDVIVDHTHDEQLHFVSMLDHIALRNQRLRAPDATFNWIKVDSAFTFQDLHQALQSSPSEQCSWGWGVQYFAPPLEQFMVIQEYYPYVIESAGCVDGEWILFSKKPTSENKGFFEFKSTYDAFSLNDRLRFTGNPSSQHKVTDSIEFPVEWSDSLKALNPSKNDWIAFTMDMQVPDSTSHAMLVVELMYKDSTVVWQAGDLRNQLPANSSSGKVHSVLRLSDVSLPLSKLKFKTYLWNQDHVPIEVRSLKAQVISGNPYLYRHINPL